MIVRGTLSTVCCHGDGCVNTLTWSGELVLHFLLQPQNILLTSLAPLGDIKIVDFGLARRLGTAGELREILGTPEYVGKNRPDPVRFGVTR